MTRTPATNRSPVIDLLRATSVIYIVGFWHLMEYIPGLPVNLNNLLTSRFTIVVLGLFVFQSGYLLGSSQIRRSWISVRDFYLKRLIRIYPLYFIALVLFFFLDLSDSTTLIKAGLLISSFHGPSPPTLWFIAMLLIFYLVAPPLILLAKHSYKFIIFFFVILLLFVTIDSLLNKFDARLYIYFPAFAAGIILANQTANLSGISLVSSLFFFLCSIAISISIYNAPETSALSAPLACLGPVFIHLASDRFKNRIPHINAIGVLSYTGYLMYLLHRPIFSIMKNIYFPESWTSQLLYLVGICFPLVFITSWIAQRTYDAAVAYCTTNAV